MIARTLRGVGALIVLAGVLAGWPAALLALADAAAVWLPDLSDPAGLLSRPDTGGLFLLIVLALGWIAWAVWTAALVVEAAAQVRGVPTPRLGGLFPQSAAAALVTAVAIAFTGGPGAALAAPAPQPASAVTSPAGADVREPAAEPVRTTPDPGQDMDMGDRDYTVARGDTLWDIAGEQLADPYRWQEIAEASEGITQPDGRQLADPDLILPGWTLHIPAGSDADPAPAADPPPVPGPSAAADEAANQGEADAASDEPPALPATPMRPADPPPGEDAAVAADPGDEPPALPPTPMRPADPPPGEAGGESAALPSTAAFDDEGRSAPVHGVLGLPDWITAPLTPARPEDAPDLAAAAHRHLLARTGGRG